MTAQGHPRTIFRRAIEHANVAVAEAAIRQMGEITLIESVALRALVVQKEPGRRSRYCSRCLRRLLEYAERCKGMSVSAPSGVRHMCLGEVERARAGASELLASIGEAVA
jgi:hypothetical protein